MFSCNGEKQVKENIQKYFVWYVKFLSGDATQSLKIIIMVGHQTISDQIVIFSNQMSKGWTICPDKKQTVPHE